MPTPARIPGYDLSPPSEANAIAALQRVWDPERGTAAWSRACQAAGVRAGHVRDAATLERVVAALSAEGGATATVARSIEIRMRTYARLAARASSAPPVSSASSTSANAGGPR